LTLGGRRFLEPAAFGSKVREAWSQACLPTGVLGQLFDLIHISTPTSTHAQNA
jgi:hypothetical protein